MVKKFNIYINNLLITIFAVTFFYGNGLFCLEQNLEFNKSLIKIHSQILSEERTILIALPKSYEESGIKYPVLYLLDAESESNISGCLSDVINIQKNNFGPEMIIVGIWNTNRNRDMIPQAVSHRPGSGGSLKFLQFISEELIPHIIKNYRVSDVSLLYGASNAGLFTVYAMLERPNTFNAFIASSPMVGHCPDFIKDKILSLPQPGALNGRVLYMIYGTEDSGRVTEYVPEFYKNLRARTDKYFIIQLEILEGEGHVPKTSLTKGLSFVFSNLDYINRDPVFGLTTSMASFTKKVRTQ